MVFDGILDRAFARFAGTDPLIERMRSKLLRLNQQRADMQAMRRGLALEADRLRDKRDRLTLERDEKRRHAESTRDKQLLDIVERELAAVSAEYARKQAGNTSMQEALAALSYLLDRNLS